jgi:hypothetical protein
MAGCCERGSETSDSVTYGEMAGCCERGSETSEKFLISSEKLASQEGLSSLAMFTLRLMSLTSGLPG